MKKNSRNFDCHLSDFTVTPHWLFYARQTITNLIQNTGQHLYVN